MTTMRVDRKRMENGDSHTARLPVYFSHDLRRATGFGADAPRRSGLTLSQLQSFAAVAKYSSLTKASMELRVSQPSISQQLRQLEQNYGSKLYRRLSKGIEITKAGQSFLHRVVPILDQLDQLLDGRKLSEIQGPASQALTVGGTFSASAVLLPTLLARLRQRHPKAELEFRTGTSSLLEQSLLGAELDLAVTKRLPVSKELSSESWRREKVVVFVPPTHPLARRKVVKLSDVLDESLIIRGGKGGSGTTENALKRLRDQGLEVNIAMRCDAPAAIKAAVRQKMGVGFAFEDSVRVELDSGEFKILKVCDLQLEAQNFIVYPRNRPLSPLAREFLKLLRELQA